MKARSGPSGRVGQPSYSEKNMNITSVSVDVLVLLTCLSGSWSCGGRDSSLERPRAIGAAQIETAPAVVLSESTEESDSDDHRSGSALLSHEVFAKSTQDPADSRDQIDFAPDVPHLVWLDRSARSNPKLFVFMPGFNNRPDMHQLLGKEAARLGYHSIGLMYKNSVRPEAPCGPGPAQDQERDCSERVRLEIIDGIDRSKHVEVTPANGIDNRLTKLLRYLDAQFPDEGWSSFLRHGEPKWSRIAVAGHSTGAGQAAMIGKLRHVDRVVMFSGPPDGADAWVSIDKTPAVKHFGLVHKRDPFTDLTFAKASMAGFRALQMERFGSPVVVESREPPYRRTHILLTDLLPQTGSYTHPFPHGSTARDSFTPLDTNGRPRLLDAWRYLIGHEPQDEED